MSTSAGPTPAEVLSLLVQVPTRALCKRYQRVASVDKAASMEVPLAAKANALAPLLPSLTE